MARATKITASTAAVRTRRAYFDCRFGQLHVRTAFPSTGGFNEGVTLFCVHPSEESSRSYARFLPEIAEERSVYAPDLPGCGESDPAPQLGYHEAADALADLAADLRLRQIDVLGLRFGAGVALTLGAGRPDLVRRLVLVGVPAMERLPSSNHESLVLRIKRGAGNDSEPAEIPLPSARVVDMADCSDDLFDAAPQRLAVQIAAFLARP